MALAAVHPDHQLPSGLERRKVQRREVTATVAFSCFTAGDTHRLFHGVVRNFAEGGMQLESRKAFNKGTILLIRMMKCPFHQLAPEVAEALGTILLAEVKWVRHFDDVRGNRCCMGVHYI